jgi:hypothetical protein
MTDRAAERPEPAARVLESEKRQSPSRKTFDWPPIRDLKDVPARSARLSVLDPSPERRSLAQPGFGLHPRHDRHRANGLQDMQAIACRGGMTLGQDQARSTGYHRTRSCDEQTVAGRARCDLRQIPSRCCQLNTSSTLRHPFFNCRCCKNLSDFLHQRLHRERFRQIKHAWLF